MINVSNNGSAIIVKATEGEYIYPSAKTELELPLNSVILTLDDSEMAVFRSASNFDVLFTALIDNLQINGASVTKDNIADKFADAATSEQGGFKYEVVDELPSEGENGVIYLVPNEEGTHTEYLYVENVGWEQVGTAEVDLSDYYTKEEVDEGNRVNAAAFNVLQKSIGLNENLETIDGKSIQAQIDEVKESVPTQFKTINNESIVGEGNIEIQGGSGEQNYVIAESESEIPTDPKNGTLVYLNGQFNVVREWSSNESVDIVKDYNEYDNGMLLIDVKTTPRYGGALNLEIYNFESSSYYREKLSINSQEVRLVNEEYSLFNTETNEFNTPYTINSSFGDLYFNVKNYNGVDMLAISWKVANDDCKVKISAADFDSPSGGMYIIEQSESVMAQYENGDWKPFPQGGGSDNAYEKVDGINFIAATEEMPPIIEDQGLLLVGASLEQMMEGGVDTVALDSYGVHIQNSNGSNVEFNAESININGENEIRYDDLINALNNSGGGDNDYVTNEDLSQNYMQRWEIESTLENALENKVDKVDGVHLNYQDEYGNSCIQLGDYAEHNQETIISSNNVKVQVGGTTLTIGQDNNYGINGIGIVDETEMKGIVIDINNGIVFTDGNNDISVTFTFQDLQALYNLINN